MLQPLPGPVKPARQEASRRHLPARSCPAPGAVCTSRAQRSAQVRGASRHLLSPVRSGAAPDPRAARSAVSREESERLAEEASPQLPAGHTCTPARISNRSAGTTAMREHAPARIVHESPLPRGENLARPAFRRGNERPCTRSRSIQKSVWSPARQRGKCGAAPLLQRGMTPSHRGRSCCPCTRYVGSQRGNRGSPWRSQRGKRLVSEGETLTLGGRRGWLFTSSHPSTRFTWARKWRRRSRRRR